jgi:uncharacterized protein (TIGR02284 family)
MEPRIETQNETIDRYNSFLRGERSAVETYREALAKIKDPQLARTLETALASHEERVTLLRDEVLRLGGNPAESSGVWGTFASLIQKGARAFGVKTAIAALEEGEDIGLKDYRRDLARLSPEAKQFVMKSLLPGQESSHRMVSDLKHSLH